MRLALGKFHAAPRRSNNLIVTMEKTKNIEKKKSNQLTQNLIFKQQDKCCLSRAIEQPVEIICRKIDRVIN